MVLWIRRPRPASDELIKLDQFSKASARAAVEKIAETLSEGAPYRPIVAEGGDR